MMLQRLQDLLAGIYDLPMEYRVDDFLFTERARLPQGAARIEYRRAGAGAR